jgi:hypothetical protein
MKRVKLWHSDHGEEPRQIDAIEYEVPVRVRKMNEDGWLELSTLPLDRIELIDVGAVLPLNLEGVTKDAAVCSVDRLSGTVIVQPLEPLPVTEWGLLTVWWDLSEGEALSCP